MLWSDYNGDLQNLSLVSRGVREGNRTYYKSWFPLCSYFSAQNLLIILIINLILQRKSTTISGPSLGKALC